jgi:hypothetical protein
MGYRTVLTLIVIAAAAPAAHAQAVEDFAVLTRAIGKDVSVVDRSGLTREGVIDTVTADGVSLRVGSGQLWLARDEIASAERMKDDSGDGALKGLIWAVVLALVPNQGYSSTGDYLQGVAGMLVILPTVGYLLDAANTERQPLYRAPSAVPTLKLSWRF